MIPIRDLSRPPVFPIATYAIVATNVLVFLHEVALGNGRDALLDAFALIPYNITHGVDLPSPAPPGLLTLITSQFLHGSFLHVFFNMLFLLVFGPEIEHLTGHVRFVMLYVLCGIAGGVAELSTNAGSHVPEIGASGAIAGILGAYLLRFPTNDVQTIVPIGCLPLLVRLPAFLVIGMWAVVQFVHGFGVLSDRVLSEQSGGTAYFAHIGGFLAGIFLIGAFGVRVPSRHRRRYRYYY